MTTDQHNFRGRLKSLELLAALFERLNVDYRLGTGALLGAVRDGDFIPWDWDVGIDVPAEHLLRNWHTCLAELKSLGFSMASQERTWINGKITCTDGETSFEIMGWRRDMRGNRRRRRLFIPGKIWEGTGLVKLQDLEVKTYANPEDYLAHFYGNWRVPVRATTESDKSDYMSSSVRQRDYLDSLLHVPGWLIKRVIRN